MEFHQAVVNEMEQEMQRLKSINRTAAKEKKALKTEMEGMQAQLAEVEDWKKKSGKAKADREAREYEQRCRELRQVQRAVHTCIGDVEAKRGRTRVYPAMCYIP